MSEARNIHEGLYKLLGEKRAFFDQGSGDTINLTSLDILAYAFLKRECVNTNKKADIYLKQFENLMKFKKTFDAKFNDKLAVNTESLQEIENKE